VTVERSITLLVCLLLSAGVFLLLRRSGGVLSRSRRDVSGVPPPVWFVCGAMIFLSQTFVLTLVPLLPPSVRGDEGSVQFMAVRQGVMYAGALAMTLLMALLVVDTLSPRSGLRPRPRDLPLAIAGVLLAAPLYIGVATLASIAHEWFAGAPRPREAHDTLVRLTAGPLTPWSWALIACSVLLAPIVEEVIYRGFLQSAILSATGRAWAAVLITSGLFMLVHWSAVPPVALPGLLVVGLVLGIAFERTGSLGVPIVMHILFNGANVALALWY
jgi:membrane protease YdiL (CAAX protease family)